MSLSIKDKTVAKPLFFALLTSETVTCWMNFNCCDWHLLIKVLPAIFSGSKGISTRTWLNLDKNPVLYRPNSFEIGLTDSGEVSVPALHRASRIVLQTERPSSPSPSPSPSPPPSPSLSLSLSFFPPFSLSDSDSYSYSLGLSVSLFSPSLPL